MKLTKTQKITVLVLVCYAFYELVLVKRWEQSLPASDPVIRGDLVFIIPLLTVLIGFSIHQFFKNNGTTQF